MVWWGQLISIIGCVALGVVAGSYCIDNMIIIGTSVAGGYCFTVGLGTLIGQFPYAYYETASWVWWVYFAFMIALMVAGFVVQCVCRKKQQESESAQLDVQRAQD